MADDLINMYLGGSSKTAATPIQEPQDSGSLIDMYLAPKTDLPPPTAKITVRPVIGNRELTDADLAGTAQTTPPEQPTNMLGSAVASGAGNVWKNIKQDYQSGIDTAVSGINDISKNMPATGVGKIGLGALGAVASPITGPIHSASEAIAELTGSPEIGEKAGFVLGSALPVAKIGSAVSKAMPTNKAISAIIDTIGEDKLPEVIQRLKENPRLSLMDVSLPIKQVGQKLVTTEGLHQNTFEKFIHDRIGSAKGTVENIYNDTMGIPVDVLQKLNSMKQAAKNVGSKQINPAIKNAGPVDVSPVITAIDQQLKPGLNALVTAGQPLPFPEIKKALASVKTLLTDGKSLRVDAKDLHSIQSGLRAKADDLLNSPDGQNRQLGYALMNVRNGIVNAIDQASPTYKKALQGYKDEKDIESAFVKGASVTRNRPGQWDDRPEFWNEWVKNASKEELEAAREGARIAVDQQINGMRFAARRGTDVPEIEFNKEKLGLLFGNDKVEAMSKKLRDERDIAKTNTDLIGNSQTAMRMKANAKVDLPEEKPAGLGTLLAPVAEIASISAGGYPGVATGALLAAKYGSKAKFKYMDLPIALRKNEKMTDLLTATGKDKDELINILTQHLPKPKPSLLQHVQNLALPILRP